MSIKKFGLANVRQLSKLEMKSIKAGDFPATCDCNSKDDCTSEKPTCGNSCGGKPGDAKQGLCEVQ